MDKYTNASFYENLKKEITETTYKNYLSRISRLTTIIDHLDLLKDKEKVFKLLKQTIPDERTFRNYLAMIMTIFKYHPSLKKDNFKVYEYYSNKLKGVVENIEDKAEDNKMSEKQAQRLLEWNEVIETVDDLDNDDFEKFVIALFTYIPPRRTDDFRDMRIFRNVKATKNYDGNYVLLKKTDSVFVFNKYKTAKALGQVKIEIPEKLNKLIHKHIKKDDKYLFVNKSGNIHNQSTFNKFINDILYVVFDKKTTVNDLRHSYINNLNLNELSIRDKRMIALSMGQTYNVSMAEKYRFVE